MSESPDPVAAAGFTGRLPAARGVPLMDAEARKKQVGGNHYAGKQIQPWDVIQVYGLDYWEGNALKYLLRDKANRLEDLKKARHYLDECIRQLEAAPLD